MNIGSHTEVLAWREHPVSAAMIGWLRERISVYQRDIPDYVVRGRIEDARAASGSLKGYQEILGAIMEDPPIEIATEVDDFEDPAMRPSLKETP